jgi:hypothetical protein
MQRQLLPTLPFTISDPNQLTNHAYADVSFDGIMQSRVQLVQIAQADLGTEKLDIFSDTDSLHPRATEGTLYSIALNSNEIDVQNHRFILNEIIKNAAGVHALGLDPTKSAARIYSPQGTNSRIYTSFQMGFKSHSYKIEDSNAVSGRNESDYLESTGVSLRDLKAYTFTPFLNSIYCLLKGIPNIFITNEVEAIEWFRTEGVFWFINNANHENELVRTEALRAAAVLYGLNLKGRIIQSIPVNFDADGRRQEYRAGKLVAIAMNSRGK